MSAIVTVRGMLAAELAMVEQFTELSKLLPQEECEVQHFLHAGMYCRTLHMMAGQVLCGAHIRIPTIVIISGHVKVFTGKEWRIYRGHHILAAEANRKQVFVSIDPTDITMLFPTAANNVKDAEEEFTAEYAQLSTRS